jgi:hypothetical protein
VFLFPAVYCVLWTVLKKGFKVFYFASIREDGVLEYLQVLLLLAACIIAGPAARRFARMGQRLNAVMHVLFAGGLVFVAIEEVSWGQRILHLSLPALFRQHNIQQEITLHNLDFVQNHLLIPLFILVGGYGACGWVLLRKTPGRLQHALHWYVPNRFLCGYFLPLFLIYSYFQLGLYAQRSGFGDLPLRGFIVYEDQEPAEFLLALGFLLLALHNRTKLRRATGSEGSFVELGQRPIQKATAERHLVEPEAARRQGPASTRIPAAN